MNHLLATETQALSKRFFFSSETSCVDMGLPAYDIIITVYSFLITNTLRSKDNKIYDILSFNQ